MAQARGADFGAVDQGTVESGGQRFTWPNQTRRGLSAGHGETDGKQ
jgi:hypothetical protein